MNRPIIYFNSLSSLNGNGSIAAYDGNKDIIAMINNDAYFYNNSVSSWEKINEDYVAGNHINISQNKIIEVSGWENKLDTSAYVETSANIINIIKNKVDISAFEIATSSINETIENKISLEEFENLSSSFITIIDTVTANSANWNNDLDTLYSAGSNININNNIISSRDWTPELNTKLDSSAFSDVSGKFVQTLSTSANWNEAYDTVTANSANWNSDLNTLYSAGPNIEIIDNTISSKDWTPELSAKLDITDFSNVSGKFIQTLSSSGNWNNTYSAVNSESANWTKAYDTVTANSANWINDLDALYSAGSNVDITNNTISSRDWTPELNTKLDSTAFTLPTSSNWTKAYDTVTANSANWDEVNEYSAGSNIDITNNTISSRDWTPELSAKLDITDFSNVSGKFIQTLSSSGNWTKAYDTVTANSANWNNDLDTLYSAGSNINITDNMISGKDWSDELNAKLDTTAFELPNSANWDNTYDTVSSNSATWNEVNEYSAGPNIEIINNTISSKDWTPELNAKLDSSAFSNVSGKFVQTLEASANWNNVYNTVTTNSANWENEIDVSNFVTSSTNLSGSYILSSNGSTTLWSQLDENYDLSGFNGIIISANSANKTIDVGYNGGGPTSEVFYELRAGQNIGIQSATDPSGNYLVISANSNSNVSLPESANWDNTYDTVTSNSANWNSVSSVTSNILNLSAGQNIGIQSATIGDDNYLIISANANSNVSLPESANWNNTYSTVNSESANWNNTYSTVNSESANWNSVSSVTGNILNLSAGQNIGIQSATDGINDYLVISANSNSNVSLPESANWTKAYDTVTANSANWNSDLNTLYSAGPNINITNNTISSRDWTPELNAKLNSSAFTLPTSSDWTKAYETVTANSASWDDVSAKLNTTAFSSVSGNFLTAIPDEYSTKDYVQSSVSSKLDTTAFSTVSGSFLTAHQTLEGYATTGDVESAVSSKLDTTVFSTVSGSFLTAHQDLSDYATTVELADKLDTTAFSDVSGSFLTAHQDISNLMPKSESANFYPMTGNPSSFLTAHQDLSNYATTASVTAKLDTTAFDLPTSANWTKAYDTVTANSANWNSDLNTLYSAGPNINITNNTISSKDWTPELNAKLNTSAFTLPTSSNWTKAYDTVTANSANWENEIDVSNFVTSSTDLSGSYILSSNGSTTTWHELEEEYELSGLNGVFISANSANKSIDISLTECYDISGFNGILVSANSANKTIDITYSGNLDDLTNNTFNLQAGQNVVLTSGENGNNKYLTISAAGIESIGTPYELSGGENINITSASIGPNNYLVISAKGGDSLGTPYNLSAGQNIGIQSATDGDTNYLVISANAITEIDLPQSANWNNTYSTVNSESASWNSVSSVTGNILNLSAGQNIGIQSATDGINDYLVISANAITEIDLPQSANWNNTYSIVTSNSANWNSVSSVTSNILNLSAGQNIGIQSATDGINNYLVISANAITEIDLPESANWNNTYNTVNSESANWNNTYSTVNSESANWNNSYNTVTNNSADWNSVSSVTSNTIKLSAGQNIGIQSANDGTSDYLVISANSNSNVSLPESANWTKAYDMVTANSANWDEVIQYSAGPYINITNNTISSKDWTPELNAKLNSSSFSNVSGKFIQTLPESANWDNTYDTVTNNSANWNSVSSVTSNILNLSAGQNIGIQSATIEGKDYLVISAIGGGEGATYVAGSNINITNNTISSRDWTPELNTKLNSTAFSNVSGKFVQTLESSANWNNVYNTVTTNSANWNIDLDTLYSAGSNISITNNTISSKDWTPELNTKLNTSAFKLPSSANWNNTYSTVTNNSADWSGMYSLVAGNSAYWGQGEGTVFELYSSNDTIGISSTTAAGNKIIYDISLEGTTTSRNYFINRQEQTDAAEYLPNTNITLPDLGNGWQIVNGEANYGDIKYTSLSAYSMNGSAYIIPEEVKLASVDIRLDVIIPSGGLSANYQKVEIVIFDDIKNEYIGKYEKWIDISYDRTEQLNFSEIITEPSSVKLYFRSEFACQTYCRTFSLVDLTYKMLLINNNVTGGSVSLPTSANWNNTYSIVTSNSANWNSVSSVTGNIINLSAGQNIGIQSATIGDDNYLVISANAITEIDLPESANWNNTYSTVANNSANWNSVSSLSAKSSSILCQNISYTATGSNINVTVPNNTYATVSGLNVTGTINVIIPATNVINGSELNSCAGRLMFSTNKPSTLNFVDSTTSTLPVIGQLPTTYSGTNYQFTCVAGVVACQEIKTIT